MIIHIHSHNFDPTWITRQLDENELVLCDHREKLAFAYRFMSKRRPSFIQVTKNLRICEDCRELFF